MEFPELLRKNKVSMLINKELNFVLTETELKEVITSMNEKEVSYCVIFDNSKKFLGLITETDILTLAEKGNFNIKAKVNEILSSEDYIKVQNNKSIASVIKLMYQKNFKNVIVTNPEDENKIEGVVNVRDFVSHLIEYFPETVYNVNLNPITEDREGA